MLTVVLKATRGDPQVKVPAPGLETGSYPQRSSASRAARANPPSRATQRAISLTASLPQTPPRSGSGPHQPATRSPAPNSQGSATTC